MGAFERVFQHVVVFSDEAFVVSRDLHRPQELQIEGCIIDVKMNGPASPSRPTYRYRVLEVAGPYPSDPDWFARPWIGWYKPSWAMRVR